MKKMVITICLIVMLVGSGCAPAALGIAFGTLAACEGVGDSSGFVYKDTYYLPSNEKCKASLDTILIIATTRTELDDLRWQLTENCRYHNYYRTWYDMDQDTYLQEVKKIKARRTELFGWCE